METFTFNNIIFLLCNAVAIYTKYKAMYIFFEECKINKKAELSLYAGYFIVNSGLYLFLKIPIVNMANNIIILFLLTFIYRSSVIKKIISAVIIQAVAMLIEFIVYYLFSFFNETNTMETIITIISRTSFYFVVFAAKNISHIKADYKISPKHILMISAISAFTIYIAVVLENNSLKNNEFHIILCTAFLFILNIFVFYIYDILNKTHREELDRKLLEQQNDFYFNQLKVLSESQTHIRTLKHDMKNHIISIKSQINDKEKLNRHLNDILDSINTTVEYAKSGDIVIDGILNYKLNEAQKEGIKIELKLDIPEQMDIKPYDTGIILGNLLDNAIEAAKKCGNDKKITIIIFYEKGTLHINIENTFIGETIIAGKKNKSNRGFGLLSVERALKNYNGVIDISFTDFLFTVEVLIYCGFK